MNNKTPNPYKPGGYDPRIILPRSVFFTLTNDEKKHLMKYWRENYTTNDIIKGMGYNNSTSLYKAIKRLGLPTDLRRHKQQLLKQEYEYLGTLPQGVKTVITNVGKDTVESDTYVPTVVKNKEQFEQQLEETNELHIKDYEAEAPIEDDVDVNVQHEQLDDNVETEAVIKETIEKDDENMAFNVPNVKVELKGEVSLVDIQKVIEFAQQMNLEIKVQG